MPEMSLNRNKQPVESYRLLKYFLLLWKCMELVKSDWGCRRLGVEFISTSFLYKEYCKLYRTEILVPVMHSLARRLGQGDMYDTLNPETDVLIMPKGASEVELRERQLVRLFEMLECHMLGEVRKRIAKELTLALAERGREESSLPTDLWKRAVMKESFTFNRPLIAETFVNSLMLNATEEDNVVTFPRQHLQDCLADLGRSVMAQEKLNYERYSMFYENMLRTHHQLLYQREREIKILKHQIQEVNQAATIEVQCEVARHAHDMIVEITAVRAKMLEMREQFMKQEQDLRERLKLDFRNIFMRMFNAHSQLRTCFDEYRGALREDVLDKIMEVRTEAITAMSKLSEEYMNSTDFGSNLKRAEQLRELQQDNNEMHTVIFKLKAMHHWHRNHLFNAYVKATSELQNQLDFKKQELLDVRMQSEEQISQQKQQLTAIKQALTAAEHESNEIRELLEKELRYKGKMEHELMQKEQSKKLMESAKQAQLEQLVGELQHKDTRLQQLEDEHNKTSHLQTVVQEKIRKDVDYIRKQLHHERTLKLDAFHRVDELQSQVYSYESCFMSGSHPSTLASFPSTPAAKTQLRSVSAGPARRVSQPTSVPWLGPTNRSLSGNDLMSSQSPTLSNKDGKKMKRPKTVGGRLRNRIAEQLLNELEPDHHQVIVQLEQLRKDRHH